MSTDNEGCLYRRILNYNQKYLTFVQVWNILFEENESRKFGDSVGFDGLLFSRLDEGDVTFGAVVVDRLHCLQKLLQFPGIRII